MFLCFAIASRREDCVLPASAELLQAFLSALLAADKSGETIRRYLTAIKDRHRSLGVPFAVPPDTTSRWQRAISRHTSRPAPPLAPVSADQLRRLLLLPMTSMQDFQDALSTAVCTVTGVRSSDLVNIDVCDVLLQYYNDPPDTVAIRVWGAKPDVARKGHHPRIGRPLHPRRDVVAWILQWCSLQGLLPSPLCSKPDRPRQPCLACGTLFRRLDRRGLALPTSDSRHPLSTLDFTHGVRRAMARLGNDPAAFDGRSCRSGALSTGADAGLPEYHICLQTGHHAPSSNPSARRYMTIRAPSALFALWHAFEL